MNVIVGVCFINSSKRFCICFVSACADSASCLALRIILVCTTLTVRIRSATASAHAICVSRVSASTTRFNRAASNGVKTPHFEASRESVPSSALRAISWNIRSPASAAAFVEAVPNNNFVSGIDIA